MTTKITFVPKFKHTCQTCKCLGGFVGPVSKVDFDLFYCEETTELVVRWGDDYGQYHHEFIEDTEKTMSNPANKILTWNDFMLATFEAYNRFKAAPVTNPNCCSVCHAERKERELFFGKFFGCLC